MKNINEVIKGAEYDFLRTNPHLGDNIMFLAFGGSHAYGTNNEDSDIDVRGVATHSKDDILLMRDFEQVIDNATDTTVYSFKKFVHLLCACNPNIIELLGCRESDYVLATHAAKLLLDNKEMFLSKQAVNSFGGYATQQLKRALNHINGNGDK